MVREISKYKPSFSTCPLCNSTMSSKEIRGHVVRCQKTKHIGIGVKQLSKNTVLITKNILCKECGLVKAATYDMNNKRPPKICNACKKNPPIKSNDKFDPLDRSISGGAFEMNRRRH